MNQSHADLPQGENAFGRACAKLRKRMGLSQRELGRLLGLGGQAVGQWERGKRSPTVEQLKRLLVLGIQRQAFPPAQQGEEAKELWLAAGQPSADFAAFWMQSQLVAASTRSALPDLLVVKREAAVSAAPRVEQGYALPWPRFDWGDALSVQALYGREAERAQLEQWVLEERGQVVCVLGLGGIGKSALATTVMRAVASHFQMVLFRSLRDAPPCQNLLVDALHLLSTRPLLSLPTTVERGLDLLLEGMQRRPCLIVLDNLETLLQEGDPEGRFQAGYEDYGLLLERVAQSAHQSCLLLTSREMPAQLALLERHQGVRALRLSGLSPAVCEQLLADRQVSGSTQDYVRLAQRYAGNPLALNIVAESISELFGGQIRSFLEQDTVIFSSIRDLLAEQWNRLSATEQALLFWLAVVREAVSSEELHAQLVPPVDRTQVAEALQALQRRSLVERAKVEAANREPERSTLHSVVLEYVTEVLVERVSEQVEHGVWEHLLSYALEQASARDYVRQAQERLIVAPVLVRLQALYQQTDAVEQQAVGYGPANLLMLLRGLRGHLRGLDLSSLSIRGVNLQGVGMQDTRLSGASLRDTVFTEAFDGITSVAISGSGTYWATGSKRGEVRVWRENGQTLHLALQAHTDSTYALAFSPDERTLASGSFDSSSVKLWDVERGALLWSGWQTGVIPRLAFAPGGSLLASGGLDGSVQLWDAKLGTPLEALPHPGSIFALTWLPVPQTGCPVWGTGRRAWEALTHPDGHLLASGDATGTIRLWAIPPSGSATCVQTLDGHSSWVTGLAFAPDGRSLASASWDGSLKLWELGEEGSLRPRQTLRGHTEKVNCVAWSPDGRTVASGSFDHTVWLWDGKEGSSRAVLHGHSAAVTGLAFTPDSRYLLSGSEDGILRLWEVERGQCVRVLQGYALSLYDLDWSPDGAQLVSAGSDTEVSIWQVESGKPLRVLHGHRWVAYGVAWHGDGRLLATGSWDHSIRLWDPTNGSCLQILRHPDNLATIFYSVAFSPDGKLLAGGTLLQGVLVWDVSTRSLRWAARTDSPRVLRLVWHPDGTLLVGGDEAGHVYVWQASDGTLLRRLERHQGAVTSVAFSPDGKLLVSGSSSQGQASSGELFVWQVESGQRHSAWGAGNSAFSGHTGSVSALTWAASGKVVVSGGSDGRLRWWDVQNAGGLECMREREAHQGTVHALKVSPDGRTLASCGDDGAIMLWDLESGEHVRTLRRDRPYERLNITGIRGLTEAQKATLRALGAIEEPAGTSSSHVSSP
jgi:WD40 repeat protein/transcriptional regulator with XRE-family HTH domain